MVTGAQEGIVTIPAFGGVPAAAGISPEPRRDSPVPVESLNGSAAALQTAGTAPVAPAVAVGPALPRFVREDGMVLEPQPHGGALNRSHPSVQANKPHSTLREARRSLAAVAGGKGAEYVERILGEPIAKTPGDRKRQIAHIEYVMRWMGDYVLGQRVELARAHADAQRSETDRAQLRAIEAAATNGAHGQPGANVNVDARQMVVSVGS